LPCTLSITLNNLVENAKENTRRSLWSSRSPIFIAKVDAEIHAEIPIDQKSFSLLSNNDIPYTDITMKNAGIEESIIMRCSNAN
jgi:hypothetical protein